MKRYIKSAQLKQGYELLGWIVNDAGNRKKVFLSTKAVSKAKALANFRSQVHERYPGYSLVEDKMNLRLDEGPQYNRWPEWS